MAIVLCCSDSMAVPMACADLLPDRDMDGLTYVELFVSLREQGDVFIVETISLAFVVKLS